MGILISILGFGFLVLIHEFGHFIMARANDVKVEEFSIGMGPRILSHQGKLTRYSIKLLPFGGSCQMKGEDTGEDDKSDDSFQSKTPLQRMSIIFAGPFMNIVTAIVLFSITSAALGYSMNSITKVLPGFPAEKAGLKAGDTITEVNGSRVLSFDETKTHIAVNGEKPMLLEVKDEKGIREVTVTPVKDESGMVIVGFEVGRNDNPSLIQAMGNGAREIVSNVRLTLYSLKALITGAVKSDNIAGPVTIVRMGAKVADNSMILFLKLIAFLSINLAVLNLLPFPALDGGWMLVLFFEFVTGKKVSEKFLAWWNGIGFVLVMALSVVIIFKDIFYPPNL